MNQTRRRFLKGVAATAVALPALVQISKQNAFADQTTEVSAEDPTAKALGYHSDAAKVDTTKFPKKAGPDGAKQLCSTCILMVSAGVKVAGKEGAFGKCSVIQTGLVNEKGWCNSWVAKPGAV